MVIALHDVWKTYTMGKVRFDALKGINLEIRRGDFAAIAGPSGSGKTTMVNMIGLVDAPTRGEVEIDGRRTGGLSRRELTRMRQDVIGFIFQSFNLLPTLNVFENVELPLLLGRRGSRSAALDKNARRERVEQLLEDVGLADKRRNLPSELSGGQQQRAAIARSLVNQPKIVIADEPTANLDSENARRVLDLMKKENAEYGATFIFSTHDKTIWEMANRVVFLHDGIIESEAARQ
ncbi:MAG: ABC transporter ATP-binding protein [Spirochaetaceae bacterium]|jgi:putative ABC transport system ATP-binding protein|nr:ABC transporter ATP-binding protein [Spirochaetaceae bacterium]